jgi:hypothetical protein
LILFQKRYSKPLLCEPQRDRAADHSGADDYGVVVCTGHASILTVLQLRRGFAGPER